MLRLAPRLLSPRDAAPPQPAPQPVPPGDTGGAGRESRPAGKARVYVAVPGESRAPAAIRSQMAKALREPSASLRRRCSARPDRSVCGYSGRQLAFDRGDAAAARLPQAEVEHVIEGQMDGHVLAYCANPELCRRLRAVDLSLPGWVRKSVFAPHYATHNADINLTFADHGMNMAKEGPVAEALGRLDRGEALPRPLDGLIALALERAGWGDAEASRAARAVRDALRGAEGAYVAQLEGVGPGEPAFQLVQGSTAPLVAMYGAIAEDFGQLFESMGIR